jgi:hypothetical protein
MRKKSRLHRLQLLCEVPAASTVEEIAQKSKLLYQGHRFPASVTSCAVCWYFRFNYSLRDIEELLLAHGVVVTYEPFRSGATTSPLDLFIAPKRRGASGPAHRIWTGYL